jgi:GNAT superfamily N-acetyltransferase
LESARRASPDDIARVVALAAMFTAEARADRGGVVWAARDALAPRDRDELADALDDPDELVLVGCIDEHVAGYAVARAESLRDGSTLVVLHDLYVEPDAREVGVGSALLDEVIAWARKLDACGVDALALPGNRDAKNFFEMHGLVARAIVVHKPLGPR